MNITESQFRSVIIYLKEYKDISSQFQDDEDYKNHPSQIQSLIEELKNSFNMPELEASRVRENEQTKEVCCDTCISFPPVGLKEPCINCNDYKHWKQQTG